MATARSDSTGRARELARLLDSAFRVPGTGFRVGLDPLLGLVPGLGDAVGAGFAFYLLYLAYRAGAPPAVLANMFVNVGVDLVLGAVPLLGDVLDAGYRANLRNLALLERYLANPAGTSRRSLAWLVALGVALLAVVVGAVWVAVEVLVGLGQLLF